MFLFKKKAVNSEPEDYDADTSYGDNEEEVLKNIREKLRNPSNKVVPYQTVSQVVNDLESDNINQEVQDVKDEDQDAIHEDDEMIEEDTVDNAEEIMEDHTDETNFEKEDKEPENENSDHEESEIEDEDDYEDQQEDDDEIPDRQDSEDDYDTADEELEQEDHITDVNEEQSENNIEDQTLEGGNENISTAQQTEDYIKDENTDEEDDDIYPEDEDLDERTDPESEGMASESEVENQSQDAENLDIDSMSQEDYDRFISDEVDKIIAEKMSSGSLVFKNQNDGAIPNNTPVQPQQGLISQDVANQMQQQISMLLNSVEDLKAKTSHVSNSKDLTLAGLVEPILKAQISTWINTNLPSMVNEIVRSEIKRLLPEEYR